MTVFIDEQVKKEVFALLNRSLDYLDSLGFIEEDNGDYSNLMNDIVVFLNKYEQEEK